MSSKQMTETERHELDVIDAIVRGGGEARPEDAALTDFALLVRNARPALNHGEAAALDSAIKTAVAPKSSRESFIFKPVFAGVCALVLLVGVSGAAIIGPSGGSGDMLEIPSSGSNSVEATPPRIHAEDVQKTPQIGSKSSSGAAAAEGVPVAPTAPGITSSTAPRDVARDTRITLAADGDEIERISDRVNSIVDEFGGYVADSKVSAAEGNRGRATFSLMIPASEYKQALAEISKLAHVRSRSQSSEDITTTVNSSERALKLLTARVNRLEDQLAAATTDSQRATLRSQLNRAKAAQRNATRRVRENRARVNYVPIALTIVADETAANKDKGTITKAFDKAGSILTAIAAVLIVVLAVLIPAALLFATGWFGWRRWNRARSERAIETAAVAQSE
jgi:hypothetical protein